MVNPIAWLTNYLLINSAIAAQVGAGVYGGLVDPPIGYQPGAKLIVFNSRGGGFSYDNVWLTDSYGFKCYGPTPATSYALHQILIEQLHGKHSGPMFSADVQATGFPLQQPGVEWWFSLCYFGITFKSGLEV